MENKARIKKMDDGHIEMGFECSCGMNSKISTKEGFFFEDGWGHSVSCPHCGIQHEIRYTTITEE